MTHLPELIRDLAIILMTGSIVSVIFMRLKQPVILGYITAGFLLSPGVDFFPNLLDTKSVTVWSELGVIFMLFILGIEFNFRKLSKMGITVAVVGFTQVMALLIGGFLIGKMLGWDNLKSLFFGGMICVSSTTIILKAYDDFQLKTKQFAQLVVGILIFEDLFAVLLMVLLTTLSLSKSFQGAELIFTSAKLIFYLTVWFLFGLFAIPWLIRFIKKQMTNEIAIVVSIGLCLMMVILAVQAGFSAALGAFVMGSILSETDEKDRIEHLLIPVKDLFSAVFFVSIGMMMDVKVLVAYPWLILGLSAFVVLGNLTFTTIGGAAAGLPLRTSIHSGLSLAQIGEFSFIIASLGLTLKVTDQDLYSMIVAISIVTSFVTPYLIKFRDPISLRLEKMIPERAQVALEHYSKVSFTISSKAEWRKMVRALLAKIFLNSIVIVSLFLSSAQLLLPFLQKSGLSPLSSQFTTLFLTLIATSPFFWGIIFSSSRDPQMTKLLKTQFSKKQQQVLLGVRFVLALILLGFLVNQFLSINNVGMVSMILLGLISFILFKYLEPIYNWFEVSFLSPLEDKPTEKGPELPPLAPWDAHLEKIIVPAESSVCGRSLIDLAVKEKFGVIIALIQRGTKKMTAPGRNEILMPFDRIFVIGNDEQLERFQNFLIEDVRHGQSHPEVSSDSYSLDQYLVTESSPFLHKPIRDSGIREKTKGLVVGIERKGQRILNPDSGMAIENGDLLWIAGDRGLIRALS